jgi:hypothetical protein
VSVWGLGWAAGALGAGSLAATPFPGSAGTARTRQRLGECFWIPDDHEAESRFGLWPRGVVFGHRGVVFEHRRVDEESLGLHNCPVVGALQRLHIIVNHSLNGACPTAELNQLFIGITLMNRPYVIEIAPALENGRHRPDRSDHLTSLSCLPPPARPLTCVISESSSMESCTRPARVDFPVFPGCSSHVLVHGILFVSMVVFSL